MISFKPIKPHIKGSSIINQDFAAKIFEKYKFLRNSFIDDVPLVFLSMDGNDRNNEGMSQFFVDINLKISTLKSIVGRNAAVQSISNHYIENIMGNQEMNLYTYNKYRNENLHYESLNSYRTNSIMQNNILYADRNVVQKRDYRTIEKIRQQDIENKASYNYNVSEMFFNRFYNRKESNRDREFTEGIIINNIDSIGSSITLKQERILSSIDYVSELIRGKLSAGMGIRAYRGIPAYFNAGMQTYFYMQAYKSMQAQTHINTLEHNSMLAYNSSIPVYSTNIVYKNAAGKYASEYKCFLGEQIPGKEIYELGNKNLINNRLYGYIITDGELSKSKVVSQSGIVNYQGISITENRAINIFERTEQPDRGSTGDYKGHLPGLVFYRLGDNREINKSNKYYSNRVVNYSRDFIERIFVKDIESIGSHITLKEREILNRLYEVTEIRNRMMLNNSLSSYVRMLSYNNRISANSMRNVYNNAAGSDMPTYSDMPAYRDFLRQQIKKEETNNFLMYKGYYRDAVLSSGLTKELHTGHIRIENYRGVRITKNRDNILFEESKQSDNENVSNYNGPGQRLFFYRPGNSREYYKDREFKHSRDFIEIIIKDIESIGSIAALKKNSMLGRIYSETENYLLGLTYGGPVSYINIWPYSKSMPANIGMPANQSMRAYNSRLLAYSSIHKVYKGTSESDDKENSSVPLYNNLHTYDSVHTHNNRSFFAHINTNFLYNNAAYRDIILYRGFLRKQIREENIYETGNNTLINNMLYKNMFIDGQQMNKPTSGKTGTLNYQGMIISQNEDNKVNNRIEQYGKENESSYSGNLPGLFFLRIGGSSEIRNNIGYHRDKSVSYSRDFTDRIIIKEMKSIVSNITLNEQGILSRIYKESEKHTGLKASSRVLSSSRYSMLTNNSLSADYYLFLYSSIYKMYNNAAGRDIIAYKDYLRKRIAEEKLHEINNNTLLYNGFYRYILMGRKSMKDRTLFQSEIINYPGVNITENRDIKLVEKIGQSGKGNEDYYTGDLSTLFFYKSGGSKEIRNRRDINNRHYYRDKEFRHSRDFIERIIIRDIESIGSSITFNKERVLSRIYKGIQVHGDVQEYKGMQTYGRTPVYNITHTIYNNAARSKILTFSRQSYNNIRKYNNMHVFNVNSKNEAYFSAAGRSISIYGNIIEKYMEDEKKHIISSSMIHNEYHSGRVLNTGLKKGTAAERYDIVNYHEINKIIKESIAINKQYAGGISNHQINRNAGTNVAETLPVLHSIGKRRVSMLHGEYIVQPGSQKASESERNVHSKSFFTEPNIYRAGNILTENAFKRNMTKMGEAIGNIQPVDLVHGLNAVDGRESVDQNRNEYSMGPASMDNLKSKGNHQNDENKNNPVYPQTKAQVEIEVPHKIEANISKNQIDRIVDKVVSEIEKKIQFERYRRGM